MFLNLLHTVDLLGEKESEYLAQYNLSQARFVVLMFLSESEERNKSSDIAAELAVSKATVTGLLDSLERDGLIERIASKEDRRIIFVQLSNKGKKLLDTVAPGYFKSVSEMTGILDEKERRQVVASMQKIKTHLSDKSTSPRTAGHSRKRKQK
ncbi:MAG: MarR family transcriptional regulator [Chthoniobacterales bacterium]